MSTVALKRRALIRYGLGQPPTLSDTGVPIVRATNIHRGTIVRKGLIYAQLHDLPLDRAPLLEPGEVLVVRSGAYTGDSALVTDEWRGSVPGYDLRVTPSSGLEPRFLAYTLLSRWGLDQIDLAKGRAAQPHLNAEDLSEVQVLDLPLSSQRAIADYLDTETARIDALIAKKGSMRGLIVSRRMNVLTEALRGSFLDAGEVAPSPLQWLDVQPLAWPAAKLTFLASLGSGHTPSRQHPEWWTDCTIPWITTGEVAQVRDDRREVVAETRERISELGLANSSATLHPAGTVFLCRTASAGYSGIMGVDMATSQDFATWTCGPRLLPRFLLLCLRAMRQDLLGRLAMGSTHKTIYMPDIEALRIPLPSIAEQQRVLDAVDERLSRLDQVADGLATQVRLLVEHRQALITAAVTGELQVPGVAA